MLEIGCGEAGGLVAELAAQGYDSLGVDPRAPAGERFVAAEFQRLDGSWDAVVAGRVLHHVEPLGPSLDHLASLAPLLIVDEFGRNLIDEAAQDWYEAQHRMLVAAGQQPIGPPLLDDWRGRHAGLHGDDVLLAALRERYDERVCERVPYLYRWLGGPSSEALEQALVAASAFPAIGYRWAGVTKASRKNRETLVSDTDVR